MLNQVAAEALHSANYVENYLDSVENLPDDVQRHLSRIRDIDVQYRSHLRDVDNYFEQWKNGPSTTSENSTMKRVRSMARIQQSLIAAQELGDEKMQIVNQLQDLIDHKTRQLDIDFKNLDYGKEELIPEVPVKIQRPPSPAPAVPVSIKIDNPQFSIASQITPRGNTPTIQPVAEKATNSSGTINERSNKRSRRPRYETNSSAMDLGGNESNSANEAGSQKQSNNNHASSSASQKKSSAQAGGKKKKRKARGQGNNHANARDTRDDTPPPDPIDPDEPTYCLCDQISFGEMILCDNDLCPIEWFHFSCVSLMSKPKGKWFCPNCRGDRPNVMKPKAQFLKELERYNKEKEEKT